jgi:hypothetical protein
MCRQYVAPGHETLEVMPPPMPPPWPVTAMFVLPTCPECGEPLGPTMEEIDTEVQGVADSVNL